MSAEQPITVRRELSASDKVQVRALAETVRLIDGADLKLDWDSMGDAGQAGDFCGFVGDQLAGYAQIDGNSREMEVTAATFPEFRRQGVFRALLGAVQEEVRAREASSLLLVSYRASQLGAAAARALGSSGGSGTRVILCLLRVPYGGRDGVPASPSY